MTSLLRSLRSRATLVVGVGGASLVAGRMTGEAPSWRLLLGAGTAWILTTVGLGAPTVVLYALVVWLAGLGLVRRLLSGLSPAGVADPLLLVAPAVLGLLTLSAIHRGAFRGHTRLSKAVLALSALTLVAALNPLQGSLLAGVAGLLFMLVPMLAFWIGRTLSDKGMAGVLILVASLAVPAALYGLAQTFIGFPSWDASWIRTSGYGALSVRTVIRPFGTFSNAAEYAFFLGAGLIAWVAYGLRPGGLPLTAGAVALLGAGVIFEASRGVVVVLVVSLCLMAAARNRIPFPAGPILAVLLFGVLLLTFPGWAPRIPHGWPGSDLIAHQLAGLSNPLDPDESTLPSHVTLMGTGMRSALSNPLGHGPGAVSMGGSKFGGVVFRTETDPSNVAVALGIPGLVAYLFVLVAGFGRTYGLASLRRDRLSLGVLGILSITFLHWLNGAQYAIAPLPWLVLGWVDVCWRKEHQRPQAFNRMAASENGSGALSR